MKNTTVQQTLLSLGVTPNLKGFEYICDMVELVRDDKDRSKTATTMYMEIAQKHGEKCEKYRVVERVIRHAITKVDTVAWAYMGGSGLKNMEFIYTLELLTREGEKHE